MSVNILMPALSPTMTEGKLSKWLKAKGDNVKAGDILAEIETDKATMEVEAVDEGVLDQILVPEGTENVAVNTPIAVLRGDDGIHLHALGVFGHHDPPDLALVDRLDLHGRLVGLDLADHLPRLHRVTDLHMPLRELALGHGR